MTEDLKIYIDELVNRFGVWDSKTNTIDLGNLQRASQEMFRIKSRLFTVFQEHIESRVRDLVEWTEEDGVQLKKMTLKGHPLSQVLWNRIRLSHAGIFIREFNRNQDVTLEIQEAKMALIKLSLKLNECPVATERHNDLTDDMLSMVEAALTSAPGGTLHYKPFLTLFTHLRLAASRITDIDSVLMQCTQLKVLILSYNLIRVLRLDLLPPTLQYLEMRGNLLCQALFGKSSSPLLVYLGLSYNAFHEGKSLMFVTLLRSLIYLDLADNDIHDPIFLLHALKTLPYLKNLKLDGNPFSVTVNYSDLVRSQLPLLISLDGVSSKPRSEADLVPNLLDDGFQLDTYQEADEEINIDTACFQIFIFKAMGFPRFATKKKNIKVVFQVEVELPLLDDQLRDWETAKSVAEATAPLRRESSIPPIPVVGEQDEVKLEKSEKKKKDVKKKGDKKKGGKKKKSKNQKTAELSPTEMSVAPVKKKDEWKAKFLEFLNNDQELQGATKFTSLPIPWNQIMKFKQPTIEIPVLHQDLTRLRDTLRSVITLRLFCKEIVTKKSNATKLGAESTDNVISRKLVAKIRVPLTMIPWNAEYLGFEWSSKDFCEAKPYPNIGEYKFGATGRVTFAAETKAQSYFTPPQYPTVHIGIGLARCEIASGCARLYIKWYYCNMFIRRDVMILHEASLTPITLKAGDIIPLNMDIFANVMKSGRRRYPSCVTQQFRSCSFCD